MASTRSWALISALVLAAACGSSKKKGAPLLDTEGGAEDTAGAGAAGGSAGSSAGAASGGVGGRSSVAGASGRNAAGSGGAATGGRSGGAAGAGLAVGASGSAGSPGGSGGAGAGGANDGGSADGGAAGAPETTLTGCATWTIQRARNSRATVELTPSGVLFSRPGTPGEFEDVIYNSDNIALTQGSVTGDFDIRVEFENFQPGAPEAFVGPHFEAGLFWEAAFGSIWQATGMVGESTAQSILINDDDFLQKPLDPTPHPDSLPGATGTIEVKRESGMVTVTTTLNDQSTTVTSTVPFEEEPLLFAIAIGSSSNSQTWDASSVVLTSVTVEGGGGAVKSDAFDCGD